MLTELLPAGRRRRDWLTWLLRAGDVLRGALAVDHQTSLAAERLPPDVGIAPFRLAQAALTNVARHAGTRKARLRLNQVGEQIVLNVVGQGRGFDPALISRRNGSGERLGLLGIRERIAQIGGTVTIISSREQGTLVRAEVPLRDRTCARTSRRAARS